MLSRQNENWRQKLQTVVYAKPKYVSCANCKHTFGVGGSYHFRAKAPVLLECGHTICEACAKKCPNKSCESCGLVFEQNLLDQTAFEVNLYMLGLLTSNQSMQIGNAIEPNVQFQQPTAARFRKSSVTELEHCSECGLGAQLRCRQCEVFFCSSCYTKIHGRALQSHQKVLLTESAIDLYKLLSNKCEIHPSEIMQFYCNDCEICACTTCLLLSHQGHKFISQSQKNAELKPQLENVLEKLMESLQRVKQTEKKVEKFVNAIDTSQEGDTEREKIEAQLTQHFAHLHGVLQNIESQYIKKLQDRQKCIGNNVNSIKEQLNEQKSQLESAILMASELLESNSISGNVKAVIVQLVETSSMPCHLVHNHVSDQKITLSIDEYVVNYLREHCTVELPSVSDYALLRTEELPKDYEIEPIDQEEITKSVVLALKPAPTVLTASNSSLSVPNRKQNTATLTDGSSEAIRITHIKDPSHFYVQLCCRQGELNQLMKSLAKQAATAAKPVELELNKLYLVQYGSDKKWYRGRITNIHEDTGNGQVCDVFYVDWGNSELGVPISKMRNMSVQSSLIPVMAKQCTLHDIAPCNGHWQIDANKAMLAMVKDTPHTIMHVFKACNNVHHVDILINSVGDGGCPISVRDALIFLEYGCFVSIERLRRINPQSLRTYFEEVIATENTYDICITHIESPDCIYVQKIGNGVAHLTKLTTDMMAEYGQAQANQGIIYTPEIGMPCAAVYADGNWYRGRISDLVGNRKVEVFFVDFGDKCVYEYDQIRRLHYKFMTVTALAFKIALKDVAPKDNQWNSETRTFMIENLRAKLLKIFVFAKEHDCYKVTLYIPLENKDVNFNAILTQQEFAISTGSSSQFINCPKPLTKKRKKKAGKFTKLNKLVQNNEIEDLVDEVEDTDPFRMQVNILQVLSPDCIYVSDVGSTKVIRNMISEVQEFYNKYKSAESESWQKDDVCVAYSAKDKSYHRAKIIHIASPDNVVVFLYDIGITETVAMQNLQSLHPKFFSIPARSFRVKLAGILPCGGSATWLSSSSEMLTDLINENQHSKFYISKVAGIENETISVELWVRETRTEGPLAPTIVEINSINRKLVKKGVALPVRGYKDEVDKVLAVELRQQLLQSKEGNICTEVEWVVKNQGSSSASELPSDTSVFALSNDLSEEDVSSEDESIESDEKVPIPPAMSAWIPAAHIADNKFLAIGTNVDQDCNIYLYSEKQNGKNLAHIDTTLQKHFNGTKPKKCDLTWTPKDMCIAQYHGDGKWYRAEVMKVLENDEIKVLFVDYGSIEECKLGTLRKRVIMGHIPIQATKCVVHGLVPARENGKWTTPELDTIHALVVEEKIHVTVLQRKSDHLVISLKLKKFNNVDLLQYLSCELMFALRTLPILKVDQEYQDIGSEICDSDNSDVIVGECIENCSLKDLAELPIFDLKPNHETIPEKDKEADNENRDEIITDSAYIPDDSELIDSVTELDISKNSELLVTPDESENIHINSSFFEESTNVSCTSQNEQTEDDDNYLLKYQYFGIPDDVDIVNLEWLCFEEKTVFWARISDCDQIENASVNHKQLALIMEDMQTEAFHQPNLENIILNAPCSAKFSGDDMWYRAVIIEIKHDSEQVKVRYVDYGNTEYQPIDKVHALKSAWLSVPVLAVKCNLWKMCANPNVPAKTIYRMLVDTLCDQLFAAVIKERHSDSIHVELYDDKCTESIHDRLVESGFFKATD